MKGITYLACPYSDPDFTVMEYRFWAANRAAAWLMSKGEFVFSPISHSHPVACAGKLPTGWDYWRAYDQAMLEASARVRVLTMPGWETSEGVLSEMRLASLLDLPVTFIDPKEIPL